MNEHQIEDFCKAALTPGNVVFCNQKTFDAINGEVGDIVELKVVDHMSDGDLVAIPAVHPCLFDFWSPVYDSPQNV